MKLKWKKYSIYFGTWIANSKNGIEYRIEKMRYLINVELNASITFESTTRTLGWCPSLQVAKDRCQQMEEYFETHKISLR